MANRPEDSEYLESDPGARRLPVRVALALVMLWAWAGSFPVRADVLPRASYETRNRLSAARRAVEQEQYTAAVGLLSAVLGSEEADLFTAAPGRGGVERPVRAEAAALLASLPPEAVDHYETWAESRARQPLGEAVLERDRRALAQIAEQFPAATVGGEAALLLGCDALDRGRPWEALAWLGRLQRVPAVAKRFEPQRTLATAAAWVALGRSDRAADALKDLAAAGSNVRFRIGDEEFSCGDDPARVLAWLTGEGDSPIFAARKLGQSPAARKLGQSPAARKLGQSPAARKLGQSPCWPVFRGDAARNASTSWQGPVGTLQWRAETMEGTGLGEAFRTMESRARPSQGTLLPSAHPLVVGGLVLARTSDSLVALDLQGGRRVWEPASSNDPEPQQPQNPHFRHVLGSNREARVWQRSYLDAPYGQLASDGRRVFFIDGLDSAWPNRMGMVVAMGGLGGGAPEPPKPHNRLVALMFEHEGKMVWSVGGATGEDEPKLAGAFFLGPPLPYDETLYVLAEIDGEITLCALEAATGRWLWSRVVAVPQQNVLDDPERRLAGATPSMADGVLVCPTSAGAVVAVEPATRSLLWGYEYPPAESGDRTRRIQRLGVAALRAGVAVGPQGSCDASATLAAGHVVLAPVESDELLCLELESGELVWKRRLEDLLYVGCIHDATVLAVGAEGLSSWNLSSGKPAWQELSVALPDGARPSGRGVLRGRFYYLPTSNSEVLEIDLADGRIAARMKTASPPGNLVALPGLLISQSVHAVEAFGTSPVRAEEASPLLPDGAAGEANTKTRKGESTK